jgi:hypothetical protein
MDRGADADGDRIIGITVCIANAKRMAKVSQYDNIKNQPV